MKVRIFLPTDESARALFVQRFGFKAMPCEGQILRFTELEDAD